MNLSATEAADALDTAALRLVTSEGRLVIPSTVIPTQHGIDFAIESLVWTRAFVAKIDNRGLRKACAKWCNYAQRQIDEAKSRLRKDLRTREILDAERAAFVAAKGTK